MADDFEKAVLITFSFDGSCNPQLKEQASSFINNIKRSAECWRLCVERFSASPYSEIKFWCLQTLHELIRTSYGALAASEKATIRTALMTWVQRDCNTQQPPLAAFLRNKVAQCLVAVLQYEYPSCWPTFFHDLISAVGQGEGVVDMFCRILLSVDEDIVSLDIPRSQDESRLSMHVKDSMREHSLGEVAGAWYRLAAGFRDKNPELAAQVLTTMGRYIPWIDINLVANDKFLPLLLSLMDTPHTGLRCAAVDCLTEILSKRMDAAPKLSLIQNMKIVGVAATWSGGFPVRPGEDDDEEVVVVRFARLLATLATEIMDSLKRVENTVISLSAVGFLVSDEATAEAGRASEAAARMLSQLFPAVLAAFKSRCDEVALPLLPFMGAYVARLKGLAKRSSGLSPETLAEVRAILEGIAVAAKFPSPGVSYGGAPPPLPAQLVAAQEELEAVNEKRRDLFTLLRNIAKTCFQEVLGFVGAVLGAVLSRPDAPWQDVEVAVSLLYELGEGAPEEALKVDTGGLATLALALVQRGPQPSVARHRLVALAVLETCVRYSRVLQQQPAAIPPTLAAFLDGRGMGHPAEDVSTRACYLFARLIKALRQNVRPYIPDVLASLQPHLQRVATTPLPASGPATPAAMDGLVLGGGSASAGKATAPVNACVDDRLYMFDAVGQLVGQEEVPPEQQLQLLGQLMQPLLRQVEENLPPLRAAAAVAPCGTATAAAAAAVAAATAAAALILQSLEAISRLSKGFRTDLVTRQRPQLAAVFVRALEVAVAAPAAAPTNKLLRARFISFVHRMVECLGSTLLPYLPPALEVLLSAQADVQDMSDMVVLVNQLLSRYREALGGLLEALLPPLVVRVHAALGSEWDWSGKLATPSSMSPATDGTVATVEDARERGELQRVYYLLLSGVTTAGMSAALLKVPPAALEAAVVGLTRGAATHVDPNVRRTCLQVFSRLVGDWCSSPAAAPGVTGTTAPSSTSTSTSGSSSPGGEVVPGFRRYAMERLGEEACIVGLLRPAVATGGVASQGPTVGSVSGGFLDFRDAGVLNLLGDAATALKLIYAKCGEEFPSHLVGTVLPAVGLAPAAQQQLIYLIREGDPKELRDYLRTLMAQSQQAQQQQQQQAQQQQQQLQAHQQQAQQQGVAVGR